MKQKINSVILTTSDHKQIEINHVIRSGVIKASRVYLVEYVDESGFNRLLAPLESVFMIEEFVVQNEEKEEKKEKRTSLQDIDDDGNDDTVVVDDENEDDDEDRDVEDDTDDEDIEEDDEEEYDDDVEKIRKKRVNK